METNSRKGAGVTLNSGPHSTMQPLIHCHKRQGEREIAVVQVSIPEAQLDTWSNVGAEKSASTTYASVQSALNAGTSLISQRLYDVYLQGSYKNTTNIFADSDIDIVVQLTSIFSYDIARLSESHQGEFRRLHPDPAAYTFMQFRDDVQKSLQAYYGSELVEPRTKCIKVLGKSGRRDADIVPCISFKRYDPSPLAGFPRPHEGIRLHRRDNDRALDNYPKRHFDNGVAKHQATKGWYKPTVRIFKNFRNWLSDEGRIPGGLAPSYFLESMLSNVPNDKFGNTYQLTVANAMIWLVETSETPSFDKLVTGSGLHWLFGSAETQWSAESARKLINQYVKAWNAW